MSYIGASTVLFDNCKIYEDYSKFGGFASINNNMVSLTIRNSILSYFEASIRGGIMNIVNLKSLYITGTTMQFFDSPDASGIYSSAYGLEYTMENS